MSKSDDYRLVVEEAGVQLRHDEESNTVMVVPGGPFPSLVFTIEAWRRFVRKWEEYDKASREAAIDSRIYKDRPDGW